MLVPPRDGGVLGEDPWPRLRVREHSTTTCIAVVGANTVCGRPTQGSSFCKFHAGLLGPGPRRFAPSKGQTCPDLRQARNPERLVCLVVFAQASTLGSG